MTRYTIDPSSSRVWIEGRSSVHPIHTRTDGLEGWIELGRTAAGGLDLRATFAAHIELEVARFRSANPLEERELKRRIDAKRHPTITGDVTSISRIAGSRFEVAGDVTFRGVTRAHTGEVVVETAGDEVRVAGESQFDVRDFGMEPPRILVLKVEPVVTVRIEVSASAR